MFAETAKLMILAGTILVLVGILILLAAKVPFLGKLPGDILIKKGSLVFFLPLATCIILSIVLTVILNLLLKR